MEEKEKLLTEVESVVGEEEIVLKQVSDIASKATSVLRLKKLTKQVADMFVESIVIWGPGKMEIIFSFEDILQEAIEKTQNLKTA